MPANVVPVAIDGAVTILGDTDDEVIIATFLGALKPADETSIHAARVAHTITHKYSAFVAPMLVSIDAKYSVVKPFPFGAIDGADIQSVASQFILEESIGLSFSMPIQHLLEVACDKGIGLSSSKWPKDVHETGEFFPLMPTHSQVEADHGLLQVDDDVERANQVFYADVQIDGDGAHLYSSSPLVDDSSLCLAPTNVPSTDVPLIAISLDATITDNEAIEKEEDVEEDKASLAQGSTTQFFGAFSPPMPTQAMVDADLSIMVDVAEEVAASLACTRTVPPANLEDLSLEEDPTEGHAVVDFPTMDVNSFSAGRGIVIAPLEHQTQGNFTEKLIQEVPYPAVHSTTLAAFNLIFYALVKGHEEESAPLSAICEMDFHVYVAASANAYVNMMVSQATMTVMLSFDRRGGAALHRPQQCASKLKYNTTNVDFRAHFKMKPPHWASSFHVYQFLIDPG